MTTTVKKGKSPHPYRSMQQRKNRPRGSYPSEILLGIYEKGGVFKCPITGEDPAEYFIKYGKIWIPQRIHHPISYADLKKMGVKNPNAIEHVMFASPNGHNMLENYMKGITTMTVEQNQICHVCGVSSWDMYFKYRKVLKMEHHHITTFGTLPHCVTCHAATSDHSVNAGKYFFPSKEFLELLNADVLSLSTLCRELKKCDCPKLTKQAIQFKFYGMGLHRFYNNKHIPVPNFLRKFFKNQNAKKFFEVF